MARHRLFEQVDLRLGVVERRFGVAQVAGESHFFDSAQGLFGGRGA